MEGIQNEALQTKETEHFSHLTEGENPIRACIGTHEEFAKDPDAPFFAKDASEILDAHYRDPKDWTYHGYALSAINESSKAALNYYNSIGLLVGGKDKVSGKNVSFMTQQDPSVVLPEGKNKDEFAQILRSRLEEMKEHCVPGTIDAVLYGGNSFEEGFDIPEEVKAELNQGYTNSIQSAKEQVRDVLGFEPEEVVGPKNVHGKDKVVYDTNNRRLYIARPEMNKD